MSDGLGIGWPVTALAVLTGLAAAALIGYLLRRRNRRGRHSMRHHKYQVREILARVEREQPPRSKLEPAPAQLVGEQVRGELSEAEPPTEVIPLWPTTDPDHAETAIDMTECGFAY